MKYRRFGRTEVFIPVISCGGMRYQFKWNDVDPRDIPAANQANLEATIHRALELGINHIETARGYGTSEMQLGNILPHLPREKMIIQTKVAPMPNPKDFLATFEKSMAYLKLDHVDFLSMHGINNRELLDHAVRKGGCMDVARQLKKDGRVKWIGFSTHATNDVIIEAINTDQFDYVNLHWYFVNELNWESVQAANKLDMGVFIISPNDKGGKLYSPPPKLVELCAPLSPMIFNDLFCLNRPEVHTLSCGASRPEDFDEHIKALEFYDKLPATIAPIEKRLRQEMDKVLGSDWNRSWWKGLPDYDQIENEVNVSEILRLYTYAKSLDLIEWGKMRYNLLGQADHWFPGTNASHVTSSGLNAALKESPFAEKIPSILTESHRMMFDVPKKRLSES